MATSFRYYKKEIGLFLIDKYGSDSKVLDVGAGEGTYYNLLKDYFKDIDAVEVYKPNIERYRLKDKYRNVYNVDIKDFKYGEKDYDIIIFGDVIEHLEIDEAQEVLKYAYDRCKEMVVAVPYCYEQGIEEGNIYEIHKQADLTPENVLERYPMLKLLFRNDEYGYYIKKK